MADHSGRSLKAALRVAAERVLLPNGFPASVSSDYLHYQLWDCMQAVCSSLSGVVATRAVFEAVGVGDGTATATGATVTWMMRDGVGMLTRIAFASIQGSSLDCEVKQWRLVADVTNDAALLLELTAPAWPMAAHFLLAAATAAKSIVGVAGGATRAAIAVHQARRDNAAEVAAKDGSQETVVNAIGLLLALLLLPVLDGRPWLTWLLVLLLMGAHLGSNMAAVRSLCFPTLNRPRLRLALHGALWGPYGALWGPMGSLWGPYGALWGPYGALWGPMGSLWGPYGALRGLIAALWGPIRALWSPIAALLGPIAALLGPIRALWGPIGSLWGPIGSLWGPKGSLWGPNGALWGPEAPTPHMGGISVPPPEVVNPKEPLLPGSSSRLRINLGAPLERLVGSEAEFRKAKECGTPDYIVVLRPSQGWVGVGLRAGAPPDAPLRGCAHALLLEELMGPDLPQGAPMGAALRALQHRLRQCPPGSVPWAALADISHIWKSLGPAFLQGLEAAGWSTRGHQLAADQWRIEWAEPRAGSHAHRPPPTTPT